MIFYAHSHSIQATGKWIFRHAAIRSQAGFPSLKFSIFVHENNHTERNNRSQTSLPADMHWRWGCDGDPGSFDRSNYYEKIIGLMYFTTGFFYHLHILWVSRPDFWPSGSTPRWNRMSEYPGSAVRSSKLLTVIPAQADSARVAGFQQLSSILHRVSHRNDRPIILHEIPYWDCIVHFIPLLIHLN